MRSFKPWSEVAQDDFIRNPRGKNIFFIDEEIGQRKAY